MNERSSDVTSWVLFGLGLVLVVVGIICLVHGKPMSIDQTQKRIFVDHWWQFLLIFSGMCCISVALHDGGDTP